MENNILEYFVVLLFLLQLKHWYVDFVNQTMEEVNSKGIYGNLHGVKHSFKHGLATSLCVMIVTGYEYWVFAFVIGLIDFITHYHIDWCKMNFGNRDIQNPKFWNHLGLDQMAHQMTYILLGYMVVG